jgi:transcriptional regulator with XRE-family HTH domain
MSQGDLAKACGVVRQTVVRWENSGRFRRPSDIANAANVLNVSLEWLKTGDAPTGSLVPEAIAVDVVAAIERIERALAEIKGLITGASRPTRIGRLPRTGARPRRPLTPS